MHKKRGMKKAFVISSFVVALAVILLVSGVFAAAENLSEDNFVSGNKLSAQDKQDITQKVEEIAVPALAEKVKLYVEGFAEKRGIKAQQINNIDEVDFASLPKEVNIENINDANLAIYQVNYNESVNVSNSPNKNLFVITYSTEKLNAQGDIIIASDKREFLNFGSVDEMSSGFLKTATGVPGSLEAGYVMMREGSITGISTSLDIIKKHSGAEIEIIVYKNGEAINFGNTFDATDIGLAKDHDIQSNGVVTFKPGDVISAYAKSTENSNVKFKSVITIVEITTK